MLTDILHHADLFKTQVKNLKEKAPMFPKVHFEENGGCIWATTMVKFSYNKVEYLRHHVESIVPSKTATVNDLYNRLYKADEVCIQFAVPCQFDEIVGLVKTDEVNAK